MQAIQLTELFDDGALVDPARAFAGCDANPCSVSTGKRSARGWVVSALVRSCPVATASELQHCLNLQKAYEALGIHSV